MRSAFAKLARLDPTRLDLALPRPWVCVLLVLAFLGFGVIVGRTVSSAPEGVLSASARPQLRLVLPPVADSPASQSTTPPASEPSPTPSGSSESSSQAGELGSGEAGTQGSEGGGSGGEDSSGKGSGGGQGSGGGSGGNGSGGNGSSGKGSRGQGSSGGKGSGGGSGASGGDGSHGSGGEGGGSGGDQGSGSSPKLPPIKHVFLVMLADEPYASVFGPSSSAPYLSQTLERRGELLVRYYAVAHDELANGIALLSGQGPTPQTEVNCPTYAEIAPATSGADGQVLGQGCVYPAATETLAGQLAAKHLSWGAYVEGMEGGSGSSSCVHPTLGAADPTLDPTQPPVSTTVALNRVPPAYEANAGAAYATFRNPLMYFDSVIDEPQCAADDVGIGQLTAALRNPKRTPSLTYIVPSLCDDGSPSPCAPGQPAGMPPADAFLRRVVPQILASKAYKHGGLLVITVDQAPSSGVDADSSSCCGQPRFPALPPPPSLPGGGLPPPAGGGQVGALLLSPYVKPGTTSQEPFNHFSLLRTIENLFGLSHLGYAAASGVGSFEASVFSAYSG